MFAGWRDVASREGSGNTHNRFAPCSCCARIARGVWYHDVDSIAGKRVGKGAWESVPKGNERAGGIYQVAGGGLKRCLAAVDKQWPSVKYWSLAFYSAWILLVMGGASIAPSSDGFEYANSYLYLNSGVPLAVVLVICGLCWRRVEPYIVRGPLVPVMAAFASACTYAAIGFPAALHPTLFTFASIGTGIGTPFLALRIGYMYSTLDSNRVLFAAFGSGMLANLLYFMCVALDRDAAVAVLSLFPLFAVALALLRQEEPLAPDETDVVPIGMLPRGFIARCALFVGVFSLAVGVVKGIATATIDAQVLENQVNVTVFASLLIAGALVVAAAIVGAARRIDFSRLYHPIIVVTALACLLSPLLGSDFLWLQAIVMNTAYNIFAVGAWCLFSNIAGQTDASPVRVFGLGRGASAVGTTLGQFVAILATAAVADAGAYLSGIGVASAIVVLIVAMFVFDERTIRDALDKTFRKATDAPSGAEQPSQTRLWEASCSRVAERYGLTSRELDTLMLLGRGRTTGYIAEALGISPNTAKGHVKNIYAKCSVHSRQELIDLVDAEVRH